MALAICKKTEWKNGDYIDTLAAAYAAQSLFSEAVFMQHKALAVPDFAQSGEGPAARARLKAYEAGRGMR